MVPQSAHFSDSRPDFSAMSSSPANPAPPPTPPTPPDDNACCQSGCVLCVYDLYQEELDRYRLALAAWQEQQRDKADGQA